MAKSPQLFISLYGDRIEDYFTCRLKQLERYGNRLEFKKERTEVNPHWSEDEREKRLTFLESRITLVCMKRKELLRLRQQYRQQIEAVYDGIKPYLIELMTDTQETFIKGLESHLNEDLKQYIDKS